MITFLASIVPLFCFRVRSRASLELEVIALRNQTGVLQRQRPGRTRLFFADRLRLSLALPNLAASRKPLGACQADHVAAMAP
jgi:hypothetical protein